MSDNVKRLEEMTPLEMIERVIQKFSLGQEIWWNRTIQMTQVMGIGPNGQQMPMQTPMMHIIMGMRGTLLGPQHYVWFVLATDPIPGEEQLEKGVMMAMENMAQQKMQQANGVPPGTLQGKVE